MPAARAASGSRESSVSPGTVFTSSTQGFSWASTMMSTRAIPSQPRTRKQRSATTAECRRALSLMRAGMMWWLFPAVYLAS